MVSISVLLAYIGITAACILSGMGRFTDAGNRALFLVLILAMFWFLAIAFMLFISSIVATRAYGKVQSGEKSTAEQRKLVRGLVNIPKSHFISVKAVFALICTISMAYAGHTFIGIICTLCEISLMLLFGFSGLMHEAAKKIPPEKFEDAPEEDPPSNVRRRQEMF